ncbi:MAG: flagellar basal body rod protein FlgB [bacterium]
MGNLIEQTVLQNTSVPKLKRLVDVAAQRQRLVASNIANVNTPGYQRQSLDFESELQQATQKHDRSVGMTDERHIPIGVKRYSLPQRHLNEDAGNTTGVNDVDIDQEMADLAQTQLIYEFGAKRLQQNFDGLKKAIRGK